MRAQNLMEQAKRLMGDKGEDYTKDPNNNQFENFDRVSIIASWFNDPIDQPFAVLIGTKLARLATLLNGKSPKNESILDSFLDLINYSALWGGKRCSDIDPKVIEAYKSYDRDKPAGFIKSEAEFDKAFTNLIPLPVCFFCNKIIMSNLFSHSALTKSYAHMDCYNKASYDRQCMFVAGTVG